MKEILKHIPGFRSGVTWKKIIASIYYVLAVIFGLAGGFGGFLFLAAMPFLVFSFVDLIQHKKRDIPLKKALIAFFLSFVVAIVGIAVMPATESSSPVSEKEETKVAEEGVVKEEEKTAKQEGEEVEVDPKTIRKSEIENEGKNQLTQDESTYCLILAEQSRQWGELLTNLGELFQNPRLGEEDWTINVAIQIAGMRILADEAMELSPPKRLEEVHELYLQGVTELKWVADNLPSAIDNLDIDLINKCADKITKASEPIEKAANKIIELSQ